MTRNPAFPVDFMNLRAWQGKSVKELYDLRDKISIKLEALGMCPADNVKMMYNDLLEQLDIMIEARQKLEDAQEENLTDDR